MNFAKLEDKCLYYRDIADYRLLPKTYVIVMLDGRSFSKLIKKRFERPFDDKFINYMNETALYLCRNVGNCKLAYVQSDEISLVLSDMDNPTQDTFFGYRLCKLQSIIASMASVKFNHLVTMDLLSTPCSQSDMIEMVRQQKLIEFDCRAWNVPNTYDMVAWFLYRQNDCIKNSKQQAAQTYLSHNELNNKHTDEQIKLLLEKEGIDWNEYPDRMKYGRFIYKDMETFYSEEINGSYVRRKWTVHDAFLLNDVDNRSEFVKIIKTPNKIENNIG